MYNKLSFKDVLYYNAMSETYKKIQVFVDQDIINYIERQIYQTINNQTYTQVGLLIFVD